MQRFLTLKEVSKRLGGRSRSALYCDMAAGRLPPPIRLGGRIYWPENDLDLHLRALRADGTARGARAVL
jgi:prophage regulatory protein